MTLNITVAARWLMVQSSDFWLTQEGKIDPVSEIAQKQVVLQYLGWSGLICYTGIATYGSHDTANWLRQLLAHPDGQRTPDRVARLVAEKGDVWLRRVPARDRCLHTFTLITHERNRAYIYLISNQERLGHDDLPAPTDTFIVSRARVRGTTCVVSGCESAVTPNQKQRLQRLLASNPTPLKKREAVAFASREAAPRAKGKVGEPCMVAHLLPDGTGGAAVFGRPKGRFLPTLISSGIDVGRQMRDISRESGPGPDGNPDPRTLAAVDWRSQEDKWVMLMHIHNPALHTGRGWPPDDVQPGGVGIRIVEE